MMSSDLDWTSELGEAVVEDQKAVLEAVQIFRRQAKAAGSLKSDAKQVVKTEKEIIIIEPADPQVIYVPQYNPTTVVVQSAPPVYYATPYPSYYYPYPPGAALATGLVWGAAIGAAWSGNRYGWGGDNDININNTTNISRGGNTVNQGGGRQGGGSSQWKSNKQPGQVSSSVGKSPSSSRAGDARGGSGGRGGATASAGGAGGRSTAGAGGGGAGGPAAGGDGRGGAGGAGAGTKPSAQPAGGGRGGESAMGGYGSGRQTTADSSRGASSRGSASSGGGGASASTAKSSGASRGGGGGWRWWWCGGAAAAVGADERNETMSMFPSIATRASSMKSNLLFVVRDAGCARVAARGAADGGRSTPADLCNAGRGGRCVRRRAEGRKRRGGAARDLRRRAQGRDRRTRSRGGGSATARRSSRRCRRFACSRSRARTGASS